MKCKKAWWLPFSADFPQPSPRTNHLEKNRNLQIQLFSLVRYVILAIYVAKIDFIVFMASLGVK